MCDHTQQQSNWFPPSLTILKDMSSATATDANVEKKEKRKTPNFI